jgi:hypothetical protein
MEKSKLDEILVTTLHLLSLFPLWLLLIIIIRNIIIHGF